MQLVGGSTQTQGLVFRWRPFHGINLPLREGNADAVLFKSRPDGLPQIAPNAKGFQGIAYPEQQLVVDRGVGEIDGERCRGRLLEDLLVLPGDLDKDRNHLFGLMVVSSTNNNRVAA